MKRALVLCGGGSRGAYEIGAWQALRELGIRLDGVYGTSIGALNAALVARGDPDAARSIWLNISLDKIVTIEDPDDFAVGHMVSNKRDVIPFLVENAKHLRMDVTPLQEMARRECDEAAIRRSGMDLGVMTFKVPQMQGQPVTLGQMKPGAVADWIVASASCFPLFPAKHIDGQRYIDGGYCDNLPIDMALNAGADEVVAVELHPYDTHPEYARMPWLRVIRPRHSLGGFLDFDRRLMARSLRLGYQDAMKVYGRFDGWLYTFRQVDALKAMPAARRYARRLTVFDAEFMRRGALRTGQPVNAPLLTAVESETEHAPLEWKDVWVRGLELCAEVMGFRVDAIYDPDALIRQMRGFCAAQPCPEKLDEARLHEAWKAGRRQVFALLVNWLDRHDSLPPELSRRLGELPKETAGAMFMREVRE
ncbi:MAG: patatin-like phospholipase family protein [Clostridia bacterium]|nr:patatin-like phospholipase family protein [Clostridia bacterium]